MRYALLLVVVLFACGGGDDGQHHSILVDSSSADATSHDAPAQTGPNAVKLDFEGTPDLIVYRDGAGPWLVPATVTGGYQLHVTDDYQVVAACSVQALAGNEDSEQLNATADDGEQFMFCGGGGSTGTTFAVTGQMVQPGTVLMQDTATGSTTPWSFSLDVSAGTHELVAIGATNMLIRRNLALTAATTIPDVDVTTDGTPYTRVATTVVGADPLDKVEIQSGLYTGNDFATLSDTTDRTIIYAPAALVVATDGVQVDVRVTNTAMTIERSLFAFNSNPTSFTLMPVLDGVTFGTTSPIAGSWGTLPTYSTIGMISFGGTQTSFFEQNVTATKQWVDKTGVTSLAFESDATGYNTAWNVPVAGAFAELSATVQAQTGSSSTGVVTGGAASALARAHLRTRR
jgi:hypothetical protein